MCLCEYGDHLRVCGADRLPRATRLARTGSSPRVRSRRRRGRRGDVRRGIISACAEQTQPTHSVAAIAGDHLRVCGADDAVPALSACDSGSSPRVRSRLFADARVGDTRGIISACAEQTTRPTTPIPASKDHLRVCGADDLANILCQKALGSSPRVRSRLLVILHPIYAPRDHLRVCGADPTFARPDELVLGSSPRVRSRRMRRAPRVIAIGIISACAEQTVVFYCGLGWSGVAEYLIHALRGVGKRRGCQYLE